LSTGTSGRNARAPRAASNFKMGIDLPTYLPCLVEGGGGGNPETGIPVGDKLSAQGVAGFASPQQGKQPKLSSGSSGHGREGKGGRAKHRVPTDTQEEGEKRILYSE
jgi:hypothetical protein